MSNVGVLNQPMVWCFIYTRIRSLYFYNKVDKFIVRSLKLKLKFEKKLMIFELT